MIAEHLRCCHLIDPVAVDAPVRLSWRTRADGRARQQTAWRVQAAADAAALAAGRLLWDSGEVDGPRPDAIAWGGPALAPFQEVAWQVRLRDQAGTWGEWSAPARFATGSLGSPWPGTWISSPLFFTTGVPMLRRAFSLDRPVTSARLLVAVRGLAELWIDGRPVGDDVLAPGYHDYRQRALYRGYDLGPLAAGEHVLAAMLAEGWYKGPLAWGPNKRYGDRTMLRVLLRLRLDDGRQIDLGGDAEWRVRNGPILHSGLLAGETCDSALEPDGWRDPGFAADGWIAVHVHPDVHVPLIAHPGPPMRRLAAFAPQRAWQPRPGVWMVDFGQNLAGRVRLAVDAEPGRVIRIRHGEICAADGSLSVENLREALASDTLVCRGGAQRWEPRFTVHGFQFAELSGLPGRPRTADGQGTVGIESVAISSDCPETGGFACSDPRLERLWRNIAWTMRANWLDVPTDCPQRDERMGWTGDAQAFVRTATCLHDVQAFFAKWHQDLRDATPASGAFPNIAPDPGGLLPGPQGVGDAAWGDAGVICPWTMWLAYADRDQLAAMLPAMRRWIAYLESTALPGLPVRWPVPGRIWTWGDWLNLDDATAPELAMTAWFAHATDLTARASAVLGDAAEAERLRGLHARIVAGFRRDFVADGWRVAGRSEARESQTGYVLALHFGLLDPAHRPAAAARLVALIEANRGLLSTGFMGLPFLLRVLCDHGHASLALRLLTEERMPSWLYPVAQGATTVWERWNAYVKGVGANDPGMNSYAHYAYGAVGEWMMTDLAGIDLLDPGFRRIRLRPRPGAGLTWCEAWHDAPPGRIRARWELDGDRLRYAVEVPPDCRARIELPAAPGQRLLVDGVPAAPAAGAEPGHLATEVGPGRYVCTLG